MNKKFLGVSQKLLPKEEGKAYWCTYRKQAANVGDLILIYVKRVGISQLFEIIDVTVTNSMIQCDIRNMVTVWLKHIETYKSPLNASLMKSMDELKDFNALRKNFQQTSFLISEEYWDILMNIINSLNDKSNAN